MLRRKQHRRRRLEEISFDDIDIDLPDLNTLETAPVQEAQAEDEISFEGLEDLFKDEK